MKNNCFQNYNYGYLIHPWFDKAFKSTVVNRHFYLCKKGHLKLREQSLFLFFHFTFLWRLCLIPSLFSRSDEDIEAKWAPSLISLLTSLLYIYRPRLSNHEQRRSIDHCSKGRSGCRRPTVLWTSQPQAILLPANVLMSLDFQDACLIHNGILLAYIWSIIRNLKGVLAINERGLIATNLNSICYANKEKLLQRLIPKNT